MTITNGYALLPSVKSALGINDATDDVDIESAIEGASRHLDALAGKGRKFWQDGSVVARTYYPSEACRVFVDDISTTTGLVVKVDQGDDGTYETTLSINSDFIVEPVNAAAEYPVRPYTSIRLLNGGTLTSWPCLTSGRAPVQVTAKFGWPAVPDAVERACVMQAHSILKAPASTHGVITASVDGVPIRVPAVHPVAKALMEDFIRYEDVDDGVH
jgi:hypothetical protein